MPFRGAYIQCFRSWSCLPTLIGASEVKEAFDAKSIGSLVVPIESIFSLYRLQCHLRRNASIVMEAGKFKSLSRDAHVWSLDEPLEVAWVFHEPP